MSDLRNVWPGAMRAGSLALLSALASTGFARSEPVRWECPPGYEVKEGLNTDFPHKGLKRAFVVYQPKNATRAAPVWVPMTATQVRSPDSTEVNGARHIT